ncbi:MAG: hypothetical protein ACSHXY_14750 [Alphaproteobacteria bacterium]
MDTTANDNDPRDRFPRGDAAGFRALLLDQQRRLTTDSPANIVLELTSEVRHSHISLVLSLLFWLAAVTASIWSYYTGQSIGLRIFTSMATIWTALWTAYLAKGLNKPRLGELTVLTALLGFVGMLLTASTQLGFPLQTSGGLSLFAFASLVVAYLTFSHVGLMTSVSACFVWAALFFDGYLLPSQFLFLLPVLICGQVWLASVLKSRAAIFGAAFVTYIWIGGFAWMQYQAGVMPPVYLASGLFVLGGAHLHVAKAADDYEFGSAPIHILLAWSLTIIGLIGVQHYSLHPEYALWSQNIETGGIQKIAWAMVVWAGLFFIAVSSLLRRRHGRMTLWAIGLLVCLYALLPLVIWFEPFLNEIIPSQFGVKLHPAFGMFMGGIISASALMFVLNNIRRGRLLLSVIGLGVLALQADLAFKPVFFESSQNILILTMGFCVGFGFMAILGKAQFDPDAPQHRLRRLKEI